MKRIKNNKGFTSIELLISVGVISLLSSTAYFLYDAISDKRQVLTELKNIEVLVGKLKDATIASTYETVSKEKLFDYGIVFNSSFPTYDIKGINSKTFEISYKDLNSRQCSDFALKSAAFKGDFILTRKVNNKVVNQSPTQIADECSNNLNEMVLNFSGLIVPDVAQVTPGTPKPPPVFAQPGSFVPALPDRGDVPTNIASALKPVTTPSAPTKGTYVPPTYVVSNPTVVVGGDIFETGGYVKPVYNDTPPPPVTSGQDDTEVRPGVPTPPPPPPALPPPPPPEPVALEWAQGYPLDGLVYTRTYRLNGYIQTLIPGVRDGEKATFNKAFNMNLNPRGAFADAVTVTITKEKFDEMAKNGYHFYLVRHDMDGPANWERYVAVYMVCKEPKKGYRGIGCR